MEILYFPPDRIEQERIKQQIQEIEDRSNVDIAIKIRERQIKSYLMRRGVHLQSKNRKSSQNFSILRNIAVQQGIY